MTGETGAEGAAQGAPNTPKPKRGLAEGAAGGGDYLRPEAIPARGREFTVVGTSWEENFAKDALIPCLTLSDGTEEEVKFKLTTKTNNKAMLDAGVNSDTLEGAEGLRVYLQVLRVAMRDGSQKPSIQIAEVTRPAAA